MVTRREAFRGESGEGEEPEILDGSTLTFQETRRALADLRRVNRCLLGYLPVLRTLLPRMRREPGRQRLLDLGTGSGEIPQILVRAALRRGVELQVVGVDRKLRHLVIGRLEGIPQLRVVADARALPFRDRAFHWALSTLFFHHFNREGNRRIVAEMRRVCRRQAVVVDLRRSRLALLLARILFPALGIGSVARHDGWVSLCRSWALGEVGALVAGEPVDELRRRFPFRFSLVLKAGGGGGERLTEPSGGEGGSGTPGGCRTHPPAGRR